MKNIFLTYCRSGKRFAKPYAMKVVNLWVSQINGTNSVHTILLKNYGTKVLILQV